MMCELKACGALRNYLKVGSIVFLVCSARNSIIVTLKA
jgi:hypothetical protein